MTEKAEQGTIPGTQQARVEVVHKAIERYVDLRESRAKILEEEVDAKARLMQAMKNSDLTVYDVDGHHAEINPGEEKVKASLKQREPGE